MSLSALATVKSFSKSQEALILIINDDRAKRILVAWGLYRPRFTDSAPRPKEDVRTAIDRLWTEIGPVDLDRLAQIAGVPVTKATKTFARLRAANLVWPDGSISEDARKIILGDLQAYVRPLLPKQPPRESPQEKRDVSDDRQRTSKESKKADRKS